MQHRLTPVLRDLFTPLAIKAPLRSAFMAKGDPPSPWKGALSGPPNITRGDYAHWPSGTVAALGAARPVSGCARIIRVMFSGPRQPLRCAPRL